MSTIYPFVRGSHLRRVYSQSLVILYWYTSYVISFMQRESHISVVIIVCLSVVLDLRCTFDNALIVYYALQTSLKIVDERANHYFVPGFVPVSLNFNARSLQIQSQAPFPASA